MMEGTFLLLMYPNYKYVATDSNSGGYPYEAPDIRSAHRWNSIEEARRYADLFKKLNMKLVKVLLYSDIFPVKDN